MVIRGKELNGVSARMLPSPPLEGLAGEVGALPLLQLTLAEQQERALVQVGVRSRDENPAKGTVVYREDAFFTVQTLEALLEVAGDEDIVVQIGGQSGEFARELALSTPDETLLAWMVGGGEITAERLAAARVVDIDPKEHIIALPMPADPFGVDAIALPLAGRLLHPL